ncbi:MAG: hypothetical protein ACPIA7_09745, partial [Akkermansiaceae bacterium]
MSLISTLQCMLAPFKGNFLFRSFRVDDLRAAFTSVRAQADQLPRPPRGPAPRGDHGGDAQSPGGDRC